MFQKFLKIFLIDRVEEHYYINFIIVSTVFCLFHFRGFLDVYFYSERPIAGFFAILFWVMLAWLAVELVRHQDKRPILGAEELISFVPMTFLISVSIIALVISQSAHKNSLERLITTLILIKNSVTFGILVMYSMLEKNNMTKNWMYRGIRRRFINAFGTYQVSISETVVVIILSPLVMGGLLFSNFNPFTQYLISFSLINAFAMSMAQLRSSSILKN